MVNSIYLVFPKDSYEVITGTGQEILEVVSKDTQKYALILSFGVPESTKLTSPRTALDEPPSTKDNRGSRRARSKWLASLNDHEVLVAVPFETKEAVDMAKEMIQEFWDIYYREDVQNIAACLAEAFDLSVKNRKISEEKTDVAGTELVEEKGEQSISSADVAEADVEDEGEQAEIPADIGGTEAEEEGEQAEIPADIGGTEAEEEEEDVREETEEEAEEDVKEEKEEEKDWEMKGPDGKTLIRYLKEEFRQLNTRFATLDRRFATLETKMGKDIAGLHKEIAKTYEETTRHMIATYLSRDANIKVLFPVTGKSGIHFSRKNTLAKWQEDYANAFKMIPKKRNDVTRETFPNRIEIDVLIKLRERNADNLPFASPAGSPVSARTPSSTESPRRFSQIVVAEVTKATVLPNSAAQFHFTPRQRSPSATLYWKFMQLERQLHCAAQYYAHDGPIDVLVYEALICSRSFEKLANPQQLVCKVLQTSPSAFPHLTALNAIGKFFLFA